MHSLNNVWKQEEVVEGAGNGLIINVVGSEVEAHVTDVQQFLRCLRYERYEKTHSQQIK